MTELSTSLAKLDMMLVERFGVPMSLIAKDYAEIPGAESDQNCELANRLQGASWIAPWGVNLPWMLPPSSATPGTDFGKMTFTLRLPQSRVRHFLTDASLYAKTSPDSNPRITRAVLRLGSERTVQLLDSEFACNVSLIYKREIPLEHVTSYDKPEGSITLVCPLFFETPLRILPLFTPNQPLPEIEYEVTSNSELTDVKFFTEIISSPGEAGMQPLFDPSKVKVTKPVVHHIPSFTTFSAPGSDTTVIDISFKEIRLARNFYVRVTRPDCADVKDSIASIDVIGPPPRSQSLIGSPLPGSICRRHIKTRFGKTPLPYYALTFAANPNARVTDYAIVIVQGTEVHVVLHPGVSDTGVTVEVCVETSERIEW
jgi:hypothetical protein